MTKLILPHFWIEIIKLTLQLVIVKLKNNTKNYKSLQLKVNVSNIQLVITIFFRIIMCLDWNINAIRFSLHKNLIQIVNAVLCRWNKNSFKVLWID